MRALIALLFLMTTRAQASAVSFSPCLTAGSKLDQVYEQALSQSFTGATEALFRVAVADLEGLPKDEALTIYGIQVDLFAAAIIGAIKDFDDELRFRCTVAAALSTTQEDLNSSPLVEESLEKYPEILAGIQAVLQNDVNEAIQDKTEGWLYWGLDTMSTVTGSGVGGAFGLFGVVLVAGSQAPLIIGLGIAAGFVGGAWVGDIAGDWLTGSPVTDDKLEEQLPEGISLEDVILAPAPRYQGLR